MEKYDLVIEMNSNDLVDLIEITVGAHTTPNTIAEMFFKDLLGCSNNPERAELAIRWFKAVIKDNRRE